jgi:putative lipoprotein (rSAM/lipoprotein system)
MRKVKIVFLKASNQLLAICISLLGFSMFSMISGCIKPMPEYGVPPNYNYRYNVKGVVKSKDSNIAIPMIWVAMGNGNYTDTNGYFVVNKYTEYLEDSIRILFIDLDKAENREFNKLDTFIDFKNAIFTNGQTEKTVDIKLKPKK